MSTAQQFGDYYYDSRYSPPVSPKSQPHGSKRKASTQDDDLEKQSLISHSLKKLRLNSAKRASAVDLLPVGVSYRDNEPHQSSTEYQTHSSGRDLSYLPDANEDHEVHEDGGTMAVDDTTDRVWVHDLNAEIAEIEAEEARDRSGIQIANAATDGSKIPQYLLKKNPALDESQPNMQMILYKDPISISVPEEHDAVRKTIIEARRRVREKQAELQKQSAQADMPDALEAMISSTDGDEDEDEDSMDID